MKRTICIAMALALTATLFVGCGCQNVSDRVDGMITEATEMLPHVTTDPTHGATRPSTATTPSTEASRPTENTAGTDDGTNSATDHSRVPENSGATYGTEPKEATGESSGAGSTENSSMPRSRGRMDSRT